MVGLGLGDCRLGWRICEESAEEAHFEMLAKQKVELHASLDTTA
jgi:hypothetical protein